MISDFESSPPTNPKKLSGPRRGLFVIDKVSAELIVGSVTTIVFRFTPPMFRFGKGEQRLLRAALEGFTDLELVEELQIKKEAIKKRWASIYEQVQQTMPNLLPQSDCDTNSKRGRQKRHHLLAYLRNHPEELRPFLH
jgi:hypothetical protein